MEVCDGKPVDIAHLRAESDAVMAELEADVEIEEEEAELLEDAEHKLKDVDMLKGFEDSLGNAKETTLAQNEDPKLEPSKVTKISLRERGLSPTTIDEEMKLKHI